MKIQLYILAILLGFVGLQADAQRYESEFFPRRKNVISGELMGSGGITSFNYSRVLGSWKNLFVDAKVGVGTDGIPHGANLNIGGGMHYFQVGLMGKLSYSDINYRENTPEAQYNVYPVFGYKLHPLPDQRFFMNVYYFTYTHPSEYTFYNSYNSRERKHWIGLGVGYGFK